MPFFTPPDLIPPFFCVFGKNEILGKKAQKKISEKTRFFDDFSKPISPYLSGDDFQDQRYF